MPAGRIRSAGRSLADDAEGGIRTSRHAAMPLGTPSFAFQALSHARIFLFDSSMIISIRPPACSSQGNTSVCSCGAVPLLAAEGDHSAIAEETFGRMSWSRMLSRTKAGRRGDHAVKSWTAGCGWPGCHELL